MEITHTIINNHFTTAKSFIKKTLKIYFVILLAACSTSIFAQLEDCSEALIIKTKEDVTFTFSSSENQFEDNLIPLCDGADEVFTSDAEFPTHWFT
ncbi:MAG: hypothetical protein ACI86M_003559 [Saprospiraceae bacterium]|jgi:hypothetical protein